MLFANSSETNSRRADLLNQLEDEILRAERRGRIYHLLELLRAVAAHLIIQGD